jgi:hypothetical protein
MHCTNKKCFEDTCKGECMEEKKKKKDTDKENWPWYRQVEKEKTN